MIHNKRSDIIQSLYRHILGREADSEGLHYWSSSSLSISEIRNLLRESDESKRLSEKKHMMEEIKKIYRRFLSREAEYSALDYWNRSGLSIPEIEDRIKGSDERKRIEAIKNIYFQILKREIEPTELYTWTHVKLSEDQVKIECEKLAETLRAQISKYQDRVCAHTIKPLHEVIEEAFGIGSDQWAGSLHIHMPGKAGEILFLMGLLPFLRKMAPKAKIIFHTLSHYVNLIQHVKKGPDEIKTIGYDTLTLADSVVSTIFKDPIIGFEIRGSDLWVSPYRTSNFYIHDQAQTFGPFYKAFADALGVVPFTIKKPTWIPLHESPPKRRIALALATTNAHSSIRRVLPFSPHHWKCLADALMLRGLTPVATGHHEDPSPNLMPGWEWIDCSLVDAVTMVLSAEYILASITGLSFLTAAFGKAQTVIIDELNFGWNWLRYGLEPFKDVIDINRLWAILIPPDGSMDQKAYRLALQVAQNPDFRGGFTIGYSL